MRDLAEWHQNAWQCELEGSSHPVQVAAYKRMSPEQKLKAMMEMWELAREMFATQTHTRHPDWDEAAVWNEVRRRLINATT
jgi:hypothetical protein